MASNSERIKEKTQKFQIVYVGHILFEMKVSKKFYVGRTNLCKHCTTDHYKTGDSPATTLSYCRAVASAWSGNDQLCLESAAPTGVKRVPVNSIDVEGTVFQTF